MHANHLAQYLDIYWAFDTCFLSHIYSSYLPSAYLKNLILKIKMGKFQEENGPQFFKLRNTIMNID